MEKIGEPDFDVLFNPRSIALIGASKNLQKWGSIVLLNILLGGYRGRVYPVNPREESILGLKAYGKLSLIPEPVDLAIIAIPAQLTKEAILDCARKGIRMAIVITSDFSETGEEGARLEKELVDMARSAGVRLVGPNTMGIYSASADLTALMPPVRPKKGGVALVSQSGNIGTQMLAWGENFAFGFSKYVSSGNEGDLRTEDYLSFFGRDPETKVILAYIEGLDDGRRFLETAQKITPKKPIIAFKGGRTPAGSRAAKSHSGSMGGVKEIYEGAFRQAGVLWAPTTEEMLEWASALSLLPLPRGNRVGIVTRGGGWGVVTADSCNEAGLEVPPLDKDLIRTLDQVLPPYWSRGNPIDLVAEFSMELFLKSLEMLVSWDKTDAVIALGGDGGPLSLLVDEVKKKNIGGVPVEKLEKMAEQFASARIQLYRKIHELMEIHKKPILEVGINLNSEKQPDVPPDISLPIFNTPERATRTLGMLYQYARYRQAVGGG